MKKLLLLLVGLFCISCGNTGRLWKVDCYDPANELVYSGIAWDQYDWPAIEYRQDRINIRQENGAFVQVHVHSCTITRLYKVVETEE